MTEGAAKEWTHNVINQMIREQEEIREETDE
jgi:hypothetical protein